MQDRRLSQRFEPTETEENVFVEYRGQLIPGIVGNISQGGVCVIVAGTCRVEADDELTLTYRDREAVVVVRNKTEDMGTTALGCEWATGPIPALWG